MVNTNAVAINSPSILENKLFTSGALAAFSARGGGGGVHFKLERTSCQQSLKCISLYNTEGVHFSTEKRNIFFVYVRYVILY